MLNDSPEEKARRLLERRDADREKRNQVAHQVAETVLALHPDPDDVVLEGLWLAMQTLCGPRVAAAFMGSVASRT
ncbi:MAG: hypothetical protein PHT19_11165 [Methylococcus sp.]|nr:hypothetical protein [Methylococcus sp.]